MSNNGTLHLGTYVWICVNMDMYLPEAPIEHIMRYELVYIHE